MKCFICEQDIQGLGLTEEGRHFHSNCLEAYKATKPKEALRYDTGKIRYDLLPPYAITELAKVYTFGANKYADNNWRKGMAWSRCLGSAFRHIFAWIKGEAIDAESQCHHLAHAVWNLLTLFEYQRMEVGTDDRQQT